MTGENDLVGAAQISVEISSTDSLSVWIRNRLTPEGIARSLRNHANLVKSYDRDLNSLDRHEEWRHLHFRAISLFINAEEYKCPIITEALIDIEGALDEIALPIDFYKRLIRLHRGVTQTGNRRTRNQFRDSVIQTTFRCIRKGFWLTTPDGEELFFQHNYEDTLNHIAETFNLSEKSIEKIIPKEIVCLSDAEPLESEDFARFITECKKRETKILRELDDKEIP